MIALLSSFAGAQASAAASAPHPEPRVIVTVTAIRGGHQQASVQRAARETWAHIVRCYKEDGTRDQGKVVLRLEISAAGQVVGARRIQSNLSEGLTQCLKDNLRRKAMPKASSGSSATVEIQLAPGDE